MQGHRLLGAHKKPGLGQCKPQQVPDKQAQALSKRERTTYKPAGDVTSRQKSRSRVRKRGGQLLYQRQSLVFLLLALANVTRHARGTDSLAAGIFDR